ncbi:sporulation protein [Bacillus sp. FJAT-27225]|uniref:Spo0B C-terminal domain-containing protein n=1 Tax=Bacillus sp. FJAT-27225 TaxID=1743144 RepID=UPI00080C2A3C|nr:Spo0B C-terminal domain-containing protein [Bacillus sp. FJAT-27225]OCA91243.1 sporulation protein [Bacillus sp. FJAT-27225]
MEKNWDLVEVLRYSRHDWLNRLQLIKGNLDLDRIDCAKAVIDKIIIDTQQESKLSNLKIPGLASQLLRANWEGHHFQLEYEVLCEHQVQSVEEKMMTNWLDGLFSTLDQAVEPFQENSLSICIDLAENGISFNFDFSGIIKETKLLGDFLQKGSGLNITLGKLSDRELDFEVLVPFC